MKIIALMAIMAAILPITVLSQATPICDDIIPLRTNCTFITPSISCDSYNYDIFYKNTTPVINDAPLSNFNDTVYQFNFTLVDDTQDYLVRLCDGTTREVIVQPGGREGNAMSFIAIGLISIGVMGLVGWVALNLSKIVSSDNEKDARFTPLKVLFLVIALIIAVGMINLNRIIAEDNNMPEGIISLFQTFYTVSIYTMMFVGFIAFAYYLLTVINLIKLRKESGGGGRFDR